ncbi:MAG: PAS domain S-box protein [Bryobacteraceae bacterium]|nr:PAS domain S-box protein [Bryobacteraceae bacterium]
MSSRAEPPPQIAPLWRQPGDAGDEKLLSLLRSHAGVRILCLAVLFTLAFGLRIALAPWLQYRAAFATFIPVIVAAAYLGGFRWGIVAAVGGAAGGAIAFQGLGLYDFLSAALFAGVGIFLSWVVAEYRAKQEHLADSRAQLSAVLESIRDLCCAVDQDWRVRYANSRMIESAGLPREQIAGRSLWEVFPHLASTPAGPALRKTMMERVPCHAEYYVQPRREWFELDAFPSSGGVTLFSRSATQRRKAEQDLQDANRRLALHLANTPLAVIEFSSDFRLTMWSGQAERMFGWSSNEVVGRRIFDFPWVFESDAAAIRRLMENMESGASLQTVSRNRNYRKDGAVIECEWYNSSLVDSAGRIESVFSFVLDVTEQRRHQQALRESEVRSRAIFDSAAVGMATCSLPEGRYTAVNAKMCEITGYTAEELKRLTYLDITHPEDRAENRRQFTELASGIRPSFSLNKRYMRRDGRLIWVRATNALIRDESGMPLHTVASIEDITAQVETEASLRAANEELIRANTDLEQFAYSASHDLKEPLRQVGIFAQLLQKRYGPTLDEDANAFLNNITGGAQRMEQLLSDLLNYTQTATQPGRPVEPVEVSEVLAEVKKNLATVIMKNDAAVVTEALPAVRVERAHLIQLFQNLVSNAIKYRSAGRAPVIRVRASSEGALWRFSIQDNGIGIPADYHKQVFGLFKRLHTSSAYPGTGIGLALCKRIVERYGGAIWVESEPEKGSTFFLTLPS